MQSSCPEIQIKILTYLPLWDLIRFSSVSKYFLLLVRDHPWDLVINTNNYYKKKFTKETASHIITTYQFREYDFSFRKDVDKIFEKLKTVCYSKILRLDYSATSGQYLRFFPNLSELYLINNDRLLDESIVALCQMKTEPFHKINLGYGLNKISDITLEAIARVGCEELNLSNRENITDVGVQKIVSSGKVHRLHLCWNRQLTEAAFEGMKGVQFLNMFKTNVTDGILKKIGICDQLDLSGCYNITDKSLLYLNCSELVLKLNKNITYDGLITLLSHGNLKKLNLYLYVRPGFQELVSMFPNVQIEKE